MAHCAAQRTPRCPPPCQPETRREPLPMPVRTVFLAAFLGLVALGGLPGQALLPGSAGAAWASDEEDAIESEVEDKVESDVDAWSVGVLYNF